MTKRSITRWIVLVALLTLIIQGTGVIAQEQNLLTNPGFESGFTTVAGDQPRSVANGWVPWHAPRTASMASFQNTQPKYIAASAANAQSIFPRIRSGSNSQIYYSFFETHDGGVYQQISGVTPGTELRFSIYAHIWSSTFEDPNVSDDPGAVALRVGIDPNGGTDGMSSDVVYTEPQIFYDTFRQYSIIVTAKSSTVTVFVRSTVGEPVQHTYIYLDDAVLASTAGGGQPANPTATPTSGNVVIASDTPQASATIKPSNTPVVVAVASDTPSNTSGTDATPTREGSVGAVATATPFQLPTTVASGPTATNVPSTGGNNPPISAEFPGTVIHIVRRGDVVINLATLYGSSIDAIIAANGLNSNAFIKEGQRLVIPVRLANPATETPSPTPLVPVVVTPVPSTGGPLGGTSSYVVQRGDTLFTIATRFNTTLGALVQLNAIANPNRILAGQALIVPAANTGGPVVVPTTPPLQPPVATAVPVPSGPRTYTIQPGDNLYRVAVNFGVSMISLAAENNITNYNLVFVGQTLVIP
jgi:LysM repeat protein